ncbi:MAG: alpha/beta fold hydrolase [Gemmataceae bacterium]|nr:alpha/beta fold hydrolase [Gemmataceae bacterium]
MTPLLLTAGLVAAPEPPAVDTSFLKQYAETRGFMLGRPAKPKVTPDGKAVLFLRSEAKSSRQSLYEFDIATGKTKELLTPDMLRKGADDNLTPEEKARRERQRVTAGGFADYHLSPDGKQVLVKLGNTLFILDRETGNTRELKPGGEGAIVDPKWSPDGKLVGYVRGYDVYAYDLAADKEQAVATGGTPVKTHGLAEFVAQEEMGRFSGYWWSPDSKSIAYEEADHAGVEQWYVADPFKPDVPPAPQFYPRPGKKNVAVRLGVKPVAGGETVWVEWDRKKYEYLASVSWERRGYRPADPKADPFPDPLAVVVQDRGQHGLALLAVDTKTGGTTPLVAETDTAWVNIPPNVPARSGGEYLWLARNGDRYEIQRRSDDGKLMGLAAPAGENVTEVIRTFSGYGVLPGPLDGSGPVVAYHVAPDPTQQQVRVMSFGARYHTPGSETGGHLTTKPGVHTGSFGNHDTSFVITSTTLKTMPRAAVMNYSHEKVGELPSVAAEPPFTPNVTVGKVGDYYTAIVRPRDFDPKKKYPVIVDVYGGPKHLHVVQAMRNWLVPQWLADQGFIVVAIDNRGTPGRGRDWEKAVYQKFGTVPLEDQVKGLHALCDKYPELDRDRVGIVGWSFGGYMAANGVLRRPDVFKAAVAGAPVTDWADYDTHYTERYMGLLPESQKAYDEASLIPLAKDLSRPLLLVHGTADDNVYYRHSLKLADALFRAGRPFEALPLPGVTHMVSADPVVMERLWAKTAGFFRQHLGVPTR